MRKQLLLIVSGVFAAVIFSLAHAQGVGNPGYLVDSYGNVVRSLGANVCIRTGSWTPALAVAGCDPDLVKKPAPIKPKAAAAPKPKAKPRPKPKTAAGIDWLNPPKPSRNLKIDHALLARGAVASTLGDVGGHLSRALSSVGYTSRYYMAGENGFVLATRLEQINEDGVPKSGNERWITEVQSLSKPTLKSYLDALLNKNPGYFRVMFFLVTDQDVQEGAEDFTLREFRLGLDGALLSLPSTLRDIKFSENHKCEVLIYEFRQYALGEPARISRREGLPNKNDLEVSGIFAALQKGD